MIVVAHLSRRSPSFGWAFCSLALVLSGCATGTAWHLPWSASSGSHPAAAAPPALEASTPAVTPQATPATISVTPAGMILSPSASAPHPVPDLQPCAAGEDRAFVTYRFAQHDGHTTGLNSLDACGPIGWSKTHLGLESLRNVLSEREHASILLWFVMPERNDAHGPS